MLEEKILLVNEKTGEYYRMGYMLVSAAMLRQKM